MSMCSHVVVRRSLCLALVLVLFSGLLNGQQTLIGQTERVCQLSPEIKNIMGMTFCGDERGEYLFVFEGTSRKIHRIKIDETTRDLIYQGSIMVEGTELINPRGLAYAKEVSGDVLYFLDYVLFMQGSTYKKKGLLFRYDIDNNDLTFIDLNTEGYEIGVNPVYALARQDEYLFVSFDPSSLGSHTARVRHGLVRITVDDGQSVSVTVNNKTFLRPHAWQEALAGRPAGITQMPGPGKDTAEGGVEASLSLTGMTEEGADYLWGTVGSDYIYLMDSKTGRGLFYFDRPGAGTYPFYDLMAYGSQNLWVADKDASGSFIVYRLNVLSNPQVPFTGSKCYREMRMEITSTVNSGTTTPRGFVYHTFCHPYTSEASGNQGVVPNSVRVNDLTGVTDYTVEQLNLDPAGDSGTRQDYTLVTYQTDQHPDIRQYKTELFIKYWTRDFRYYVYPHLAFRDGGPEGTHYLEDDDILYGVESDPASYQGFIARVRQAMFDEYHTEPDMENPYWAALNVLEYIVENYHYPNDEAGYYATYDYTKKDYNSHPGNIKASYSADDNYVDNITACSGTGAMVGGIMRYIGLPCLWLGTSKEITLTDGFFGPENNEAEVSNGHRYNKVWLGSLYGWQDIDATPRVPAGNAYNAKPKEMSQWEIMQKAFARVTPKRLIHNMQAEFWDKMHIPFRNVCVNKVNSCGSTRYNLLGSYTYPDLFNLSGQFMRIRGVQFIENVNVDVDEQNNATITWQKTGDWDQDSDARLRITMEKQCLPLESCYPAYKDPVILAESIPCTQEFLNVPLGQYQGGSYRVTVEKIDDPVTGNIRSFILKDLSTWAGGTEDNDNLTKIYPNPTCGKVYVDRNNVSRVEVFDINGNLMKVLKDGFERELDFSGMSKGQYVVRIYVRNGTVTEKVLVY
jgi:hypothetical protein